MRTALAEVVKNATGSKLVALFLAILLPRQRHGIITLFLLEFDMAIVLVYIPNPTCSIGRNGRPRNASIFILRRFH